MFSVAMFTTIICIPPAPPGTATTLSLTLFLSMLHICTDQHASALSDVIMTQLLGLSHQWGAVCADVTCSNAHVNTTCAQNLRDKAGQAVLLLQDLPLVPNLH
jgi:hypothetical protein